MRGLLVTAAILTLAVLACGGAHAEAPELHIYNWSDYIGPDTTLDDYLRKHAVPI